MGLHQLCEQIEQDSKVRAASILKEAKADARRIEDAAQSTADESVNSAKQQALEFATLESKERINAANLEASKLISEAKDEAVRQSLSLVWEKYSQSCNSSSYKQKLKQWATSAIQELGISGAVLRSNSRDKSTLSSLGFKTGDALDCVGGVRAESKDGKIMVDYTLESQFESKKEELAIEIYSSLFSGDSNDSQEEKKANKVSKKR